MLLQQGTDWLAERTVKARQRNNLIHRIGRARICNIVLQSPAFVRAAVLSEQALRKAIAVLLVVLCPCTLLMAERPSAMLYATGAVFLNGMPAAKSMSVFAGDRIDTADGSVVSVNRNGFSLVVDQNSSVQYQSDGFTILRGKASARTSLGMTAHVGRLAVIPKSNSALFDVSSDGKTILVASREGTLTLTDGVETATLEPGYTAKVILDPQDQEPKPAASASGPPPGQNPSSNPETTASSQDQGPKPAATTTGDETRHKKGWIILIIASAAATAAIVCILECGGGGATPVSPVTP